MLRNEISTSSSSLNRIRYLCKFCRAFDPFLVLTTCSSDLQRDWLTPWPVRVHVQYMSIVPFPLISGPLSRESDYCKIIESSPRIITIDWIAFESPLGSSSWLAGCLSSLRFVRWPFIPFTNFGLSTPLGIMGTFREMLVQAHYSGTGWEEEERRESQLLTQRETGSYISIVQLKFW